MFGAFFVKTTYRAYLATRNLLYGLRQGHFPLGCLPKGFLDTRLHPESEEAPCVMSRCLVLFGNGAAKTVYTGQRERVHENEVEGWTTAQYRIRVKASYARCRGPVACDGQGVRALLAVELTRGSWGKTASGFLPTCSNPAPQLDSPVAALRPILKPGTPTPMKLDQLEALLTPQQKRQVIETILYEESALYNSKVTVRYEVRRGWDFAVRSVGDEIKVTFSVPMTSSRFRPAVIEAARALDEVIAGKKACVLKGDPLNEEGK